MSYKLLKCLGLTPLHLATKHGCGDVAKLLIAYNANENITDKNGKFAKDYGLSEIFTSTN